MGDPISPGKKTKLVAKKIGVKVLKITDSNKSNFLDGKEELNFKMLDFIQDKTIFLFEVTGDKQKVEGWIEYESSKVHDDFYKQYQKGEFKPPRVAQILKPKNLEPGKFIIKWNGRDDTPDKRFILAGKYLVKFKSTYKNITKTVEAKFTIAKPEAYNYGVKYKKHGSWESSKPDVDAAEKSEKSLKDSTGYAVISQLGRHAIEAVEEWKSAGVIYFTGHASPFSIVFHGKEGVVYKKKDKSIVSLWGRKSGDSSNDVVLSKEKKGAFKDLFFMMLNGCRTGNDILIYQYNVTNMHPKGIDGKHGKKTTAALAHFQKVHKLTPNDGKKHPSTLKWFNVSTDLSEKKQTKEIQKKLTSYTCGKADGKWGPKTKKSVRNYQTDHPDLKVTEELDDATFAALDIGVSSDPKAIPKNVANAMKLRGADIILGFVHKVDWKLSTDWAIDFWDNLAKGQGFNTAADNARAMIDKRKRKQFAHKFFAMKGISTETTLHPARYGATGDEKK